MAKNIVICCDGTGNQLDSTYSNVIKLFMMLEKDSGKQLCYYDPGLGTMGDPNAKTPVSDWLAKLGGLIFGNGLRTNVWEAYGYLMEYYEPGDKIYMYGFSRGAYTVRVVAALIHAVGLLDKGCQQLIPYAWIAFKKSYREDRHFIAETFKKTYSRDVDIHLVGVWDTVTSIGLLNRKRLPYTTRNSSIKIIRHALSIDERRTYFRQNLFFPSGDQDVNQVWFAGVHCDVGGSYNFRESGLSQIALEWMVGESVFFGLHVNKERKNEILYDTQQKGFSKPDANDIIHRSLSGFWWILEFIPKYRPRGFPIYFPLNRRRRMFEDPFGRPLVPTIHRSVLFRTKNDYQRKTFGENNNYVITDIHWQPNTIANGG